MSVAIATFSRTRISGKRWFVVRSTFLKSVTFRRWFNPYNGGPPPAELLPFTGEETQSLSSKQVPTCLALKGLGNSSLKRNLLEALMVEIPISAIHKDGTTTALPPTSDAFNVIISRPIELKTRLDAYSETGSVADYEDDQYHRDEVLVDAHFDKKMKFRMDYVDPWAVHAGRCFRDMKNLGLAPVINWFGNTGLISHKFGKHIAHPDTNFKGKGNTAQFHEIVGTADKLRFLTKRTFWGSALKTMSKANDGETEFAKTFWKVLTCFLNGEPNPTWSDEKVMEVYASASQRSPESRANRLHEMLKTIDGMFLQRYLTVPEEFWSWNKYDRFVLSNLAFLIEDEFIDGELNESYDLATPTRYSQLKTARKDAKLATHSETLAGYEAPRGWLSYFGDLVQNIQGHPEMEKVQRISSISQTRGCGLPPPVAVLYSKQKALLTFVIPPLIISPTKLRMVAASVDEVINSIPDSAFTGLTTKARISISAAACWEKTNAEGGTLEAIHSIVQGYGDGEGVRITDLHTGDFERIAFPHELTAGEYVFWGCLSHVLALPPDELSAVWLVVAKEPGKARSVTKGRACLKVILDVIAGICAYPLGVGLESSKSGMRASNHGWNFFKDLFVKSDDEDVFKIFKKRVENMHNSQEVTKEYADCYFGSTDFETATDFIEHVISKLIAEKWMGRCGIPDLLQGILLHVVSSDRDVYFTATGPLVHIGEQVDGNLRKLRMVRGVLMGDPFTKLILHIINASIRALNTGGNKPAFWRRYFFNAEETASAF